ncbi:MFS transporter [Streptomyces sp. NPDC051018]|uniref:MFS transporter n=1 Tax=Streptomyces sp. NPDC051018 TaxID=3365639 RepID=UPI0037931C79
MRSPASLNRWLGLVVISLGVALIVMDATIVNVIVPSVIGDLGVDSAQMQWIQESYAIVFAALLLVAGRLADIVGARLIFLTGVVVFGATSVLAGLTQSGDLLVLARFLQGAGAAMILPTSLSLLNASFTGKERGQAFAVWGSTIGAGAALGPLLGGWLAEHASWRWAFGVNVPLSVLICVGVLLWIAPSPRAGGRLSATDAVLSVLGLGLLAFGLIEGRVYGWFITVHPLNLFGFSWDSGPSPVLAALALAAFALTLLVRRQAVISRGSDPAGALMDVRLFSVGSFRNGNIVTLIIGLGEFGVIAVLPLWLQFTLGYSALEAGLALVPLAVGSFFASGAGFALTDRISALGQVRLGVALEVAGLVWLGLIATTATPWWSITLALFVYGVGVGFATAQVTSVTLADVPEADIGQGSGIQSAFRELGAALGIAVLTTVFFTSLGSETHDRLTAQGVAGDRAESFSRTVTDSAGAAIAPLADRPETAPVADAARSAMADSVAVSGYTAAGFVLVGLVATALIPARPEEKAARPAAVV